MRRIITILTFTLVVGFTDLVFSQNRGTEPDPQRERLLMLADSLRSKSEQQKAEVERLALQNGWVVRTVGDFGESQIMFIDEFGLPQAYTTYNLNAARTVGTNQLWTGGTTGLNLMGNNYTIGIWDGGGVRTTHTEFGSRVTIQDGASLSNHGTHVGGTMVASGVDNTARGMAQQATLRSYDWDSDYSEMATEAANGLTLSNHSYGQIRGWAWGNWATGGADSWHWWGTTSVSTVEDYRFGFYDDLAKDLDQVAVNAPNYLIVFAAGNDRDDAGSGTHWVRNAQGNWVSSSATRNADGNYDCLPQQQVAKNILTVGAVNDITGGYSGTGSVVATAFTSWGPTDDGRIKPDIVGNGASLWSTSSAGNFSYTTMSGTSMASPNVTGTLALLQEHYRNLRGNNGAITSATMSAAALKGLVINTANEAGANDGPDYSFGWGLLNAIGAAQKITDDHNQGGLIVQGILNNSQTIDYTYYSDGSEINVTICWTDPPGTPPAASLDPTALMLVNNLNLRVIRQDPATTYFPWVLNPASPANAATKGNNTRDNVETVNIKNPSPGYYTIRINHSGALTGGQQAYAMIVTGLSVPPSENYCTARATSANFEQITRVQFGSINNYSSRAPGGYHDYRGLVTSMNKGSGQAITVTMSGGAAGSLGRVYVDWNQDGDFADANETIILGSGAGPNYSTTINVPTNALGGYTTMRIRVGFSAVPPACGTVTYGETEDYTIFVVGTPGLWTGTKDNDWFNPKNWHDGKVPTSTVNVTIPSGTPFQPVIGGGNIAYCNNLVIQSGALLTQNSISYFYVYGNFDSDAGQFLMNGTTSYLYFAGSGNTWWDDDNENDTYTNVRVLKDIPTAILNMWQSMTCSGTFEIREGIFQIDASWTLTVTSTSASAFRIEEGGVVRLSGAKSINVTGGIYFLNGSNAEISGGTMRCGGNFRVDSNTPNDIALTGSTLILNGTGSQSIQDFDGGNLQLHHLTIDKPSGTATIGNANLNIAGSLVIQSGTFSLGSYSCNVAGTTDVYSTLAMTNPANNLTTGYINWNSGSVANVTAGNFYVNTMWDFKAGCNAQITPGNTAFIKNMQYPTEPTAHFGNLVIQPFSAITGDGEGRATYPVNVAGNLTVQSGASWFFPSPSGMIVSGNSNIQNGGALTFFSSGIFNTAGTLTISGTLNMNSSATALVNNGFSLPASGTLNINNGSFVSDNAYINGWTFIHGALNISSGLFELTNNAPNFSASATTNISGGIIRTGITIAADLGVTNFRPTGGTVEILGAYNSNLFIGSDNWFHNLRYQPPVNNSLFLQTNVTIKNNLIIDGGVIISTVQSPQISVGGDFNNNSPFTGFSHGNGTVIFNGSGAGSHQHVTGIINFYNVTNAKAGGGELRFQGTANIANNFLANGNNVVSGPSMNVGGLLDLSTGSINLTAAGPVVSVNNFTMGGSLGVAGGSFTCNDITNNGIFGIVTLSNGAITFNQDPGQWTDLRGTFTVSGGTMTVNGGSGESWWGFAGTPTHVAMSGGLLDFANPGVFISPSALFTSNITGGLIKTSGNFLSGHANFQPAGNFVELYGGSNANIYTQNGSYFHNLRINKSGGSMLGYTDAGESDNFDDVMLKYIHQLETIAMDLDKRETLEIPEGRSGVMVTTTNVLNINNDLSVNAGMLSTTHTVSNSGNASVNAGGKIVLSTSGSLLMGASKALTVNNGGAIELNGDIDNQPKISRISSGNYALNIESGATIGAVYGLFEYMSTNGVNLKPGSMVDPAKAFHYCTFRNGQSGGRLMTINNSQSFAVNYANFPNNTWGGNYNVFKTENAGIVVFGGHNGLFAGEANEWDPFSRIHWGGEIAPFVNLNGVDIAGGQDLCFEATNTLTIGGGGSIFHVQDGANVNLVAGQKIVMLDGTRVFSGGYMLARITTTSDYCSLPPALMSFEEESLVNIGQEISTDVGADKFFSVFPNPTNGKFSLEFSQSFSTTVTIQIYGIMGELISHQIVSGSQIHNFDLSGQPKGVYIIRVLNGEEVGIGRLIRQ